MIVILPCNKQLSLNISVTLGVGLLLLVPLFFACAERISKSESEFVALEQANKSYLQLPALGSTQTLLEEQVSDQWGFERTTQSLDTCMTASHWHGFGENDDESLTTAVDILTRIEMYKYYFQRIGIPKQVWESKVSRMRQVALAIFTGSYSEELKESASRQNPTVNWKDTGMSIRILEAFANTTVRIEMLKALEEYSEETNSKYHFLPKRGGCGGPNPALILKTNPPNALVYIIPEFRHLLCKRNGYNPYDTIQCTGWQLSQDGRMNLVGRWHYIATWPDGSTSKGPFRISNPGINSFTLVKSK